ncbi:MAG: hypothetical protein RR382_06160, partial [Tannerellaceae bacterium]
CITDKAYSSDNDGIVIDMVNKEKINSLLAMIGKLQSSVTEMQDAEETSIPLLTQTGSIAFSVLEQIKQMEVEQIQTIGSKMMHLQKEMELLSHTLESFQLAIRQQEAVVKETIAPTTVIRQTEEAPATEPTHSPKPTEVIEPTTPAPIATVTPQKEVVANKISDSEPTGSEKANISLNDIIEKKRLSDFRKAFSLNDRFRFRRELFGGDEVKMNIVIDDLNAINTFEESIAYINNVLKWNLENEQAADFIKLLEKRFL